MFCNFRPDRGRELTKALKVADFMALTEPLSLYATMTNMKMNAVHVYEKDIF
ncbi:MAG: hypothetical protein ACLRZ2_02685 [Veillonella sp.]